MTAVAPTAIAQPPSDPSTPAADSRPRQLEVRFGGTMIMGERNAEFSSQYTTSTGSLVGVEGLIRGRDIGLSIRTLSGDFAGQPRVISADVRAMVGPSMVNVTAGLSRRTLSSPLGSKGFDFALLGFSSALRIGGTGLRTLVSGAAYVPYSNANNMKGGLEGDASLIYTIPKLPVYVQLGYRTEVFTGLSGDNEAPEELRGVRGGLGLQLGGR